MKRDDKWSLPVDPQCDSCEFEEDWEDWTATTTNQCGINVGDNVDVVLPEIKKRGSVVATEIITISKTLEIVCFQGKGLLVDADKTRDR